jgi:hypothetical protein
MIAILNKNSFPHWLNGFRNIICCKNKIRVYSYKNLLKIVVRIDTAIKISSLYDFRIKLLNKLVGFCFISIIKRKGNWFLVMSSWTILTYHVILNHKKDSYWIVLSKTNSSHLLTNYKMQFKSMRKRTVFNYINGHLGSENLLNQNSLLLLRHIPNKATDENVNIERVRKYFTKQGWKALKALIIE